MVADSKQGEPGAFDPGKACLTKRKEADRGQIRRGRLLAE